MFMFSKFPAVSREPREPLVAPFLIKLFEIVSSPASDYLICWSEVGDSFRIIDRTRFAQVHRKHAC